jgi:hypothetical protein
LAPTSIPSFPIAAALRATDHTGFFNWKEPIMKRHLFTVVFGGSVALVLAACANPTASENTGGTANIRPATNSEAGTGMQQGATSGTSGTAGQTGRGGGLDDRDD